MFRRKMLGEIERCSSYLTLMRVSLSPLFSIQTRRSSSPVIGQNLAPRPHEADRRLLRTEAMRSHLGHWVPCACILR